MRIGIWDKMRNFRHPPTENDGSPTGGSPSSTYRKRQKDPFGSFCLFKRMTGVEPASSAWEANVLPIDHTRLTATILHRRQPFVKIWMIRKVCNKVLERRTKNYVYLSFNTLSGK